MIKKVFFTGLCAASLYLLAACVKNDPPPANNPNVSVDVVNASSSIINFYIDGARQSIITGINPLASNGYVQTASGARTFTFKQLFNTDSFKNADTLFSLPVPLDYRKDTLSTTYRYSVFLSGLARNTAFVLRDTLQADSKNAKVRFVTSSPSMPAFRVFFNDTLVYNSSTFKSVKGFRPFSASIKRVDIKPVNGNNILYTTNITVLAGRSYTLFTQDESTSTKFRAGLITNQ
ncbi:DUF4397 domain-containing protein [Mucilaginibacter sp. CSA2-8R]|uniref:DUF4397 domain-containing protein n=1 Tax=Mucilaginibacter sp. CSA2-8R TaxID=3141542 RepID=UPI00315C7B7C